MALTYKGRVIEAEGWGTRAANDRAPIWSLSKSITAACVGSLVDEGLLSFESPLGRYLPGLRPATAAITVAQLITHRSGLPGHTPFGPLTSAVNLELSVRLPEEIPFAAIAVAMRNVAPTTPTGAGFAYSNLNYLFLGQLIETVAQQPYVEVCNARLLRPAGIRDAGLDPRWGALLWSTGGWLLSPAEYLAFAATIAPGGSAGPKARAFLRDVPIRGAPARDPLSYYSLGVLWQPSTTGPMISHNGSWFWRHVGTVRSIDEDAGSQFRWWPNGLAWCATYAGVSLDSNPDAYSRLVTAIARLRGAVG